jgi:large subunit ribosomal protein L4
MATTTNTPDETTDLHVDVVDLAGATVGAIDLPAEWFDGTVNVGVMHDVVTAQRAASRQGTHKTKTRGEVRGGGAKPWRQKGTGRARAGSSTGPHWRGGGVAHGPKTRNYAQRTPKKMIRLALRSALSDRAAEDKVLVVDDWGFDTPSTKAAVSALAALKLEGKVLVVLGDDDVTAAKSFRNLTGIQTIRSRELNAYDVLVNDWVVFTEATLPGGEPAPAAATTEEEG